MSKRTETNMADNCQNHMLLTCIQLVFWMKLVKKANSNVSVYLYKIMYNQSLGGNDSRTDHLEEDGMRLRVRSRQCRDRWQMFCNSRQKSIGQVDFVSELVQCFRALGGPSADENRVDASPGPPKTCFRWNFPNRSIIRWCLTRISTRLPCLPRRSRGGKPFCLDSANM